MMKEGWKYKKLGEVCTIISGQDYKSIQDDNGLYPIYGSGGLMGYATQFRCPQNTIIIGRKGSINNPILVEQPFWNVDTAFGIVTKDEILQPKYFFFFCKNYDFFKHNVAVTIPSLRRVDLVKITIPVPPLDEQKRIVEELDLLSGIIEKQKQQLKELDTLAQSIFYDMFGDILNAPSTRTLKDVAQYFIGLTYKPGNVVDDHGTIVLRSSNIQNNNLDFNDIVRVNTVINSNKFVHKGDILMCSRNGSARLVGKVARIKNIEENMTFGAFMTIIRSQYNDFLFYFFLSPFFRSQLLTSQTATINQITTRILDGIKLNIPNLDLQDLFASKIEAIEKQKETITKSIEETQKLFDYTMDKYFG